MILRCVWLVGDAQCMYSLSALRPRPLHSSQSLRNGRQQQALLNEQSLRMGFCPVRGKLTSFVERTDADCNADVREGADEGLVG